MITIFFTVALESSRGKSVASWLRLSGVATNSIQYFFIAIYFNYFNYYYFNVSCDVVAVGLIQVGLGGWCTAGHD